VHTVDLVTGIVRDGHLPLYGLNEVASFLSWSLVLYFVIAQTRYPGSALAGLLFPTAFILEALSAIAPVVEKTPDLLAASPVFFSVHAGMVLLAYGAFVIMFMAGVMYIAQEREIKRKNFGAFFHRLPSLDTCDSIGSRALGAGFIMLTVGIATGMMWSRSLDGVYWRGDPTEVIAVCTWLVYLFLVHYRLTAGWRGRRAALVSIVGFGLVVFSLMLVRFTSGFHGL
jgi:ABC-type transport system involved in cytochrome c biogenesis permease subunit